MITETTISFSGFDLNEIQQIKSNAVEIYKHLMLKKGNDDGLCEFYNIVDDTDIVLDFLEKHLNFVKCNREMIYNLEYDDFIDFLSKIDNIVDETLSELSKEGRRVEITEADINRYLKEIEEEDIYETIDNTCCTSDFIDFLKDNNLLVKFLAEKVF